MRRLAALLVVAHVGSLGCGGSDGPTEPTPRTQVLETVQTGSIPGQSSVCENFRMDASGSAYASVGFATPIELGVGRCTGTRSIVARSATGEVTATLPAGECFARFEHTGDGRLDYRLVLRYLIRF